MFFSAQLQPLLHFLSNGKQQLNIIIILRKLLNDPYQLQHLIEILMLKIFMISFHLFKSIHTEKLFHHFLKDLFQILIYIVILQFHLVPKMILMKMIILEHQLNNHSMQLFNHHDNIVVKVVMLIVYKVVLVLQHQDNLQFHQ